MPFSQGHHLFEGPLTHLAVLAEVVGAVIRSSRHESTFSGSVGYMEYPAIVRVYSAWFRSTWKNRTEMEAAAVVYLNELGKCQQQHPILVESERTKSGPVSLCRRCTIRLHFQLFSPYPSPSHPSSP